MKEKGMEDFINYLLKEYQLPAECVCHKVAFNHSAKTKVDKLSKVPITNNIITVKIECFDKDHKSILAQSERFINGQIQRSKFRKLVNISPDELNNKFGVAKGFICNEINKSLNEKLKDLNEEMTELKTYCGNVNTIIPTEFVNEVKVASTEEENKKNFEF